MDLQQYILNFEFGTLCNLILASLTHTTHTYNHSNHIYFAKTNITYVNVVLYSFFIFLLSCQLTFSCMVFLITCRLAAINFVM